MTYQLIRNKAKSDLQDKKERLNSCIGEIGEILADLPYQGDVSEDSQKVALQACLNELESNVTGLVMFDCLSFEQSVDFVCSYIKDTLTEPSDILALFRRLYWDNLLDLVQDFNQDENTTSHPGADYLLDIMEDDLNDCDISFVESIFTALNISKETLEPK